MPPSLRTNHAAASWEGSGPQPRPDGKVDGKANQRAGAPEPAQRASSTASAHADNENAGRIALKPGQSVMFGRDATCDIILENPHAAPQQARLTRSPEGVYTLRNLSDTDSVYVNGLAVRESQLAPGAEARIGGAIYVFTGSALIPYDDSRTIQIDALNLRQMTRTGLFGRKTKVLLDDISLSIPPGAFIAIVGSSGAGKTTLLDALSGQRPAQEGVVLYNGRHLYQSLAQYRHAQGIVPQDDIIHQRLTVERALYYAARLRLPRTYTHRQIQERVDETLADINMTAQRRQLVSKLSGGQRKRVSIGVELLARPGIFFLDEPTSGLDPALDRHIMQLLRKLADRGQTIVLTTHTMAHIDACDYVCFLAPGGRLAYFGSPQQMQRHFGMTDYADIYAAIHENPDRWVALFRQTPDYLTLVAGPRLQSENKSRPRTNAPTAPTEATQQVSAGRQFLLLTARYLETFLRDRVNLLILLAQAPIIALLVVLLTKQSVVHNLTANPGQIPPQDIYAQRTLFIMVCSAVWFGIINAAREIVKERPIYRRERALYLRIAPYTLSKMVVLAALALMQSAILLAIVGARAGYPTHGLVFPGANGAIAEMLLTLWLVALAGSTMGLMVSALAPNADRAVSLVPILLVPQIIFANVIFSLSGVGAALSWLMPSRWGMQAIGSIAHVRDRFTDHLHQAFYEASASHVIGFWVALGALGALYLALALAALRRSDAD